MKTTRICKICGCEYPYCKTFSRNFRYQDVACSPEHAAEYFRRIDLSRAVTPTEDHSNDPGKITAEMFLSEQDDEDEDDAEEDDEDE